MSFEEYLDLAADSLAKASVHKPLGTKPLWKHKGWQLPAYIQHIAAALIKEKGMTKSRAIATAVAAVKRWAAGVGNVDAGTRAAARKALAEWTALKAKAAALSEDDEDYEEDSVVALAVEAADAISEELDLSDEGGVDLAVPTNIKRLETVEAALLDYISNEVDSEDKVEAKSILQRIMGLIAKDRAENAAGHKIPAYFADEGQTALAELFFDDGSVSLEDGLIYKPILREGKWKYSPLDDPKGTPIGITVVKDGKSDPSKMVVSMSEVLKNFEKGAVEHVAIPTSHQNKVYENTGFTRDLRMAKDKKGRWVLEAGLDFTEPDIKEKTERGTIANTSAGLVFNYIEKESGKKHNVVLEHVALTNRPWLNDMKPFGVAASQDGMTVLSFSEEEVEMRSYAEVMDEIGAGVDVDEEELELADSPKKPYGNVTYADPGYQSDGKARYPLDTETHIRAAWSYINKAKNAAQYSSEQLARIKGRIKSAMKRIGAKVEMSDDELTNDNEVALRVLLGNDEPQEVDTVEDTEKSLSDLLKERFNLSEEEVAEKLEENKNLKLSDRERDVADKIKAWEGDKKSPAVLKIAEGLLLADEGTIAVSLADESGKSKSVTLTEAVEALVAASPAVNLDEQQVTDEDTTKGTKPEEKEEEVELSAEIAEEARRLFLYEGKTEAEAIQLAKDKFADKAGE